MLPLDREVHSQRVTENKNTNYLGNIYDQTTKGTNRTKMGCFVESKTLECVFIFIILWICINLIQYSKTKALSAKGYSSVLGIFYFSSFSATCTQSTPFAQRSILVNNNSEKLNTWNNKSYELWVVTVIVNNTSSAILIHC